MSEEKTPERETINLQALFGKDATKEAITKVFVEFTEKLAERIEFAEEWFWEPPDDDWEAPNDELNSLVLNYRAIRTDEEVNI